MSYSRSRYGLGLGATSQLAPTNVNGGWAPSVLSTLQGIVQDMATYAAAMSGVALSVGAGLSGPARQIGQNAWQQSGITLSDVQNNNASGVNQKANSAIQWAWHTAQSQTGGNSPFPDGSGQPGGNPIGPNSPVGQNMANTLGLGWGFNWGSLQQALSGNFDFIGLIHQNNPTAYGGSSTITGGTMATTAQVCASGQIDPNSPLCQGYSIVGSAPQQQAAPYVPAAPPQPAAAPAASLLSSLSQVFSSDPIQMTPPATTVTTAPAGATAAGATPIFSTAPVSLQPIGPQIYQPSATPVSESVPPATTAPVSSTSAASSGSITDWITANPLIAAGIAAAVLFMFSQGAKK